MDKEATMIISAIDPSINSSGVVKYTLDDDLYIQKKEYLGFTDKKKFQSKNILPYVKKQFKTDYDQYNWMYSEITKFITGTTYVGIEGYAFGSIGKVFQIGEFCGGIKLLCYNLGMKLRIHDPLSIKLFSTGSGKADKQEICQVYSKLPASEKLDLDESFFTQKGSPAEDIVDAYWICNLLWLELKLRKGLIALKDLPEEQIRVMNRVTKAHPTNLLDTEFLSKE